MAVSALLHAAVIAALIITLPEWLKPTSHSDDSKNAIAIEMVRLPPPAPAPAPAPQPEPQATKTEPVLQSPTSETVVPPPAPKKAVTPPRPPKPKVIEPPPPPTIDPTNGAAWFNTTTPVTPPSVGKAGAPPDYLTQIRLRLEQHKTYPRIAQTRHQEGLVVVEFVIDRSGHVLRHAVAQSSGYSVLDKEADAIITRSDPLPPMPPEIRGDVLRIVIPIQFHLSDAD